MMDIGLIKKQKKKRTDTERIEMLWDYILSLDFNGEITMDRWEDGYYIEFTFRDWRNFNKGVKNSPKCVK
jgi:hypothetical protein|tara:strand:- start:35 stop:244 length:210 start_codon:yes stop_codon:yes gene_type:complete